MPAVVVALPTARVGVVDAYLASLSSDESRRTMATCLRALDGLTSKPWHALTNADCQAMRAALLDRLEPATVNKHLSALRGILRQCWRDGLMTADEFQRAADVRNVASTKLPAGRALPAPELEALFRACDVSSPAGARDAAALAALYAGGLREAEAAALDLEDWDGETLRVRCGKGRKAREVPVPAAREALTVWIGRRGQAPGALLCPVTKGGRVIVRHMSEQAIYGIVARIQERAGAGHVTPHDLRRTFCTDILARGAGLRVAQEMMGHADPRTTARYDRQAVELRRQAAARLTVPKLSAQETNDERTSR